MLHVDDDDALDTTAAALRAGQVVVIPTDTVYGLAALPGDADAVRRIYAAKDRPEGLPLPVLGASLPHLLGLGIEMTDEARALADRWWPGPLTMVFGFAADAGPPPWLDGRDEVAVRIPRHPFTLALLERVGVLAVTSANRHGAPTPTSADGVRAALGAHVDLVVDGGPLRGEASTLVNVRARRAVVEREGALSARAIADTLVAAGGAP
ncbi:MAG: L-threonylcarbamoyladenylate synthase [Acidimicrobiales bacterium]